MEKSLFARMGGTYHQRAITFFQTCPCMNSQPSAYGDGGGNGI